MAKSDGKATDDLNALPTFTRKGPLLTKGQRAETIDRLTRALSESALQCPVERIFPLADCAAAHEAVEAGNRAGAILLSTA